MKKRLKKVILILFIILLFGIYKFYVSANSEYYASLVYPTKSLYTITNWAGNKCLGGQIPISENFNGTINPLSSLPTLTLDSTDGSFSYWVYTEKRGNEFYFDVILDDIDLSKTYEFKIKSNNSNNIYPTEILNVSDAFLKIGNLYITITDNKINISTNYSAPLAYPTKFLSTITNWAGNKCLGGQIPIFEDVNGTSNPLTSLPSISLVSTDGTLSYWVYVEKRGNEYYFDVILDDVDLSKTYEFKIKSNNSNNTYPTETLNVSNALLKIGDLYITITDNKINISTNYSAPLAYPTKSLSTITNWAGNKCLGGQIPIFEDFNSTSNPLTSLPSISLVSTDGTLSYWVYVEKRGNEYYFDVILDDVDLSKTYEFKIKPNNTNNMHPAETLKISDTLLRIGNTYISIIDNQITFPTEYSAELLCEPANLYFIQNWAGNICLAGDLSIYIDNMELLPNTLPTITFISEDCIYTQKAYVELRGNKFYFDVILDNIDISKQYYIQIQDSDINNISTQKTKNLPINLVNNNIPHYSASVHNSFITFNRIITAGTYGMSGLKVIGDSRGTDLKYYKIGHGENVLFATFAMHGYEDLWAADGKELTIIAEEFTQKLALANDKQIMNNWTIYIFLQCNPDGANYGYTNNGVGRCTITGVNGHGVDMNRCWTTNFEANYTNRNYTGSTPFEAYEAIYLRDFLLEHKSQYGQTILIDLHGWTTQLIGDRGICLDYYGPQFYGTYNNSLSKYTSSYGKGYLVNWAKTNLGNLNGIAARSALIELPSAGIINHNSVVNAGYSQKYYNATINMLKDLL